MKIVYLGSWCRAVKNLSFFAWCAKITRTDELLLHQLKWSYYAVYGKYEVIVRKEKTIDDAHRVWEKNLFVECRIRSVICWMGQYLRCSWFVSAKLMFCRWTSLFVRLFERKKNQVGVQSSFSFERKLKMIFFQIVTFSPVEQIFNINTIEFTYRI